MLHLGGDFPVGAGGGAVNYVVVFHEPLEVALDLRLSALSETLLLELAVLPLLGEYLVVAAVLVLLLDVAYELRRLPRCVVGLGDV